MTICEDNGHGEIVHSERNCPACKRIEEIEIELEQAKDAMRRVEHQADDLQAQLDVCESEK